MLARVAPVVILGCGYTGARAARRLLASGARILATTAAGAPAARLTGPEVVRVDAAEPETLAALAAAGERLGSDLGVLCCVPPVPVHGRMRDVTGVLLAALPRARRVVHLSTTAVYGEQTDVDERTPPAPRTEDDRLRLAAEEVVRSGPWSGLVLRAAAIYGPGRGVDGRARRRNLEPDRVVSRIHVDDLAALCVAALASRVEGAWPVADDEPATPREVAEACTAAGGVALDLPTPLARSVGRRVDGRAIRALLGVELAYPSYRAAIGAGWGRPRR